MTTTLRRQQRYDHRLRELVRRTGELRLATNRGVPRSTARAWLCASPNAVVGLHGADLTDPELRQEILTLQRRVQKLAALLRLALAVRPRGERWLTGERLPDGPAKARILSAVDRARTCIPLRGILRFLHLSPSRFHAWRRRQRACALDDQASCPRSSPQRLTRGEVQAIEEMVTSPAYRHVPTRTLAVLAQRLGTVCASPSTWYRLVRRHGWRRPRLRVHPGMLTGLARCGCCGGGVAVKTRAHGRRRDRRYTCASYHHRGKAVCGNAQEVGRHALEDLVLEVIRQDALQPDLVRDAVAEAIRRFEEQGPLHPAAAPCHARLHEVDTQLERLTAAVAAGGELRSLLARMEALESEREQLARSVARVQKQTATIRFDRPQLERELLARVEDWRGLLGRQVQITRQILGELLTGRISCTRSRTARVARSGTSDLGRVADRVNLSTKYGVPDRNRTGLAYRRKPAHRRGSRLAGWSSEIVPQIVP